MTVAAPPVVKLTNYINGQWTDSRAAEWRDVVNPATGEVVKCGSLHPVTLAEWAVQNREAQCIKDYKEQGYVRVAGPKS